MHTLLDMAKANLKSARIAIKDETSTEADYNLAAFHLQQTIELAIKYQLEQEGVGYPKTHIIEKLCDIAEYAGIPLGITDYVDEHAEMFSTWEAQGRYVSSYAVNPRKLDAAMLEVEQSIEQIENIVGRPFTEHSSPDADMERNTKNNSGWPDFD